MDIHVQVNRIELNRVIRDLQRSGKAVGLTVQHVIWEIAALCAQDCVKYTPPRGETPGTWNQQRKMGEKAIVWDLLGRSGGTDGSRSGLFGFYTDEMKIYEEFNGGKGLPNFNLVKLKSGAVYLVDKNLSIPNAGPDQLRGIHLKHRGKNGRVSRAGQHDRKIGRWKAKDKYFGKKAVVQGYVASVTKRVGSLKAGWLRGLFHFSAKAMRQPNVPDWVRNQVWDGDAVDAVAASGSGYVKIENTAHHRGAIRPDMVAFIQDKRQRDANKWIYKRLEKIAARFNGGAVTGRREIA